MGFDVLTVVLLKDQVLLECWWVVLGKSRAFIFMLGLMLKMQALQSFEMSRATSLTASHPTRCVV